MRLLTPEAGGIFGAYTHYTRPTRGRGAAFPQDNGFSRPRMPLRPPLSLQRAPVPQTLRPFPLARHVLLHMRRQQTCPGPEPPSLPRAATRRNQPHMGLPAIKKDRHPTDDVFFTQTVFSCPVKSSPPAPAIAVPPQQEAVRKQSIFSGPANPRWPGPGHHPPSRPAGRAHAGQLPEPARPAWGCSPHGPASRRHHRPGAGHPAHPASCGTPPRCRRGCAYR